MNKLWYTTVQFCDDNENEYEASVLYYVDKCLDTRRDFIDDFEITKNINNCSSLVKLIFEWCMDDNGINVLYKNNGIERYPDFKLYKMISRHVHNHTPQSQLDRKEFSKFLIQHKNVNTDDYIINIDEFSSYT